MNWTPATLPNLNGKTFVITGGNSGIGLETATAHPGYSATNLQSAGVGMEGGSSVFRWVYRLTNALLAQSAERGAYPMALAAAGTEARPGVYYGPTAFMESRGPVGEASCSALARDEVLARQLWEKTEALVGPFFKEAAPQ